MEIEKGMVKSMVTFGEKSRKNKIWDLKQTLKT